MAAKMAVSEAVVEIDGIVFDPVMVVVRNNVAKVTEYGEVIYERAGVVAVEQLRRNAVWTIRFDDGGPDWDVTRSRQSKPCGYCG